MSGKGNNPLSNGDRQPERIGDRKSSMRIVEVSAVLANIAVALTLLITIMSFRGEWDNQRRQVEEDEQRARKDYSIQLISRFGEGRAAEARDVLYRGFLRVGGDQLNQIAGTPSLYADLAEAMAETAKDPADFRASIAAIVDFYDTVAACLETELCDEELLEKHFGEYGRRFGCYFGPTIEGMRDALGDDAYGLSLDRWTGDGTHCA